jgi:hypothetical protein
VTLSETLAKAEREAEQRAAAVAALQADVVALQGTLTAAREVGKAAIAALRIDTVVPAKPDGSRGWRQLAMRFLLPERVKIGGHGLVQHSDRVAKIGWPHPWPAAFCGAGSQASSLQPVSSTAAGAIPETSEREVW